MMIIVTSVVSFIEQTCRTVLNSPLYAPGSYFVSSSYGRVAQSIRTRTTAKQVDAPRRNPRRVSETRVRVTQRDCGLSFGLNFKPPNYGKRRLSDRQSWKDQLSAPKIPPHRRSLSFRSLPLPNISFSISRVYSVVLIFRFLFL